MKIYSESLNSEQTLDLTTLIYCFIVISFVFDEQKKKNSQGFRFLKKICTEEATLSINYKKKKEKKRHWLHIIDTIISDISPGKHSTFPPLCALTF